jgi:tetratricopeptide (TPR) repeat protein
LGLARAEFYLKDFKRAKNLFIRYQSREPLQPQSHYFLARIYEKEKDFQNAAAEYQHAMRLGLINSDTISRLLKISYYLKEKDDIIKYVTLRYKGFKREFLRTKRLDLKRKKKIKGLHRIEKKMTKIEERLSNSM